MVEKFVPLGLGFQRGLQQKSTPHRGLCPSGRLAFVRLYKTCSKRRAPNMSATIRFLGIAVAVLSLTCGIQGQDRESCSNATLHGSYGLHATGTLPGGAPIAAVGRFEFDGEGN